MSEHEQVYELNGEDWNFLSYWTKAVSDGGTRYSGSSDVASLDEFLEPFKIKRAESCGNTWVIPGVDSSSFSEGKIIRTILEQYYSTVLTDELRVKVADTLINQSNLDSLVSEYVPELEGELNFIQETMTAGNDDFYEVDLTEFPTANLYKTVANLLGAEACADIAEAYNDGKLIRFNMNARVQRKDQDQSNEPSTFGRRRAPTWMNLLLPFIGIRKIFRRGEKNTPVSAREFLCTC